MYQGVHLRKHRSQETSNTRGTQEPTNVHHIFCQVQFAHDCFSSMGQAIELTTQQGYPEKRQAG